MTYSNKTQRCKRRLRYVSNKRKQEEQFLTKSCGMHKKKAAKVTGSQAPGIKATKVTGFQVPTKRLPRSSHLPNKVKSAKLRIVKSQFLV